MSKIKEYVPMSKNNTMTNMYRTILLVLPALLLLAACADDVTTPAEPADTLAGQPVRFTATGLTVTPAGMVQTKADADFSTITVYTVYMTDAEGNTWQADYTYNETNSTWQADDEPLYWPTSTDQYTFTAISPKGTDPHITLPATWTAEDLTKYEAIRATYGAKSTSPTKNPISLTLRHALVKVVVKSSSPFVYLTEAPYAGDINLQNGTASSLATTFIKLLKGDNDTHTGYILPPAASFQVLTEDNIYEVSNTIKDESGNDKNISAGTSVTIELKTQP